MLYRRNPHFWVLFALIPACASILAGSAFLPAQGKNQGFELHADKSVTQAEIGLPIYPGAKPLKDGDEHSVDLGFTIGDSHFRLLTKEFVSHDAPSRILDFYRKPLSRYGEVLECDHGQAIGPVKKTAQGLTCESRKDSENHSGISSDDHELRAGSPDRFHMVAITDQKQDGTRFGLAYIELPKEKKPK